MKKKALLLLSLVFAVSMIFASAAFAQGPDDTQSTLPPQNENAFHPLDVVAEMLNMTPEELKDALRPEKILEGLLADQGLTMVDVAESIHTSAVERVNQALADGNITQEQADKMLARIETAYDACVNDGECSLPHPKGNNQRPQQPRQMIETGKAIAELLGMTPQELLQTVKDGTSLVDIAAEKGVSMDDIASLVTESAQERLDQALADGKITQEQADEIQAKIDDLFERCATEGQCMPPKGAPQRGNFRNPSNQRQPDNGSAPFNSNQDFSQFPPAQAPLSGQQG